MPRPDKKFVRYTNLEAPVQYPPATSWSPEPGATENAATVDLTEDTIDITADADASSKWDLRGTSAHVEERAVPGRSTETLKEWIVDRVIDGRTYRRTDAAVFVETEA